MRPSNSPRTGAPSPLVSLPQPMCSSLTACAASMRASGPTKAIPAAWLSACLMEQVSRCNGAATVEQTSIARGVFGPAALGNIAFKQVEYHAHPVPEDSMESLINAVQDRMRMLEVDVAAAAGSAELVVIDGPLNGRENVPGAIGYIKSHRVEYLEPPLAQVLASRPANARPSSLPRPPVAAIRATAPAGAEPAIRGLALCAAKPPNRSISNPPSPARILPRPPSPATPANPTRTRAPHRTSTPSAAWN